MLGEINQTERRQIPYGIMNVRNLKNKLVNIMKRNRRTDVESKLAVTGGQRNGRGAK